MQKDRNSYYTLPERYGFYRKQASRFSSLRDQPKGEEIALTEEMQFLPSHLILTHLVSSLAILIALVVIDLSYKAALLG